MSIGTLLVVVALMAPATGTQVDCFGSGVEAMRIGRGDAALAAFQAAFGHPSCRHHRGSLLLNMAAAFDLIAADTGEARYACAAAVRYLGVVEEPATPTMLEAARRGARAATARCGRPPTEAGSDELGLDEVLDNGTAAGLATTLTIGSAAALAAGGTLMLLAADAADAYEGDLDALGRSGDYDTLAGRLNRANASHEKAARFESMGVVLLGVGGVLAVTSIWAWLDVSDSGVVAAAGPTGAAIVGVW